MDKPKHSTLKASSAWKWISCPASIKMKRELKPSKYAKEGDKAHELAFKDVDERKGKSK